MAAPFDPYRALSVSRGATAEEIRGAYRKLARKYHPDVRPDDAAALERFKEVTRANEILSDAKKRALFDEFGDAGLREGFNADEARAWQRGGGPGGFGGGYGPMGGDAGDFEDMFGDLGSLFGGGRRQTQRRGQQLRASLRISLSDAVRGAQKRVSVPRPDLCPACQGSATRRGACMRCGGDGVVQTSSSLQVRIPAGARPGTVLRLPNQGGQGSHGAGDLLLTLEVEAHPYFSFEGDDLLVKLPLTIAEALLGASVSVPTADGAVQLRVPPGTQPGTRLRLRGKGGTVRGRQTDLFAQVTLVLPTRIGEPERAAADALGAAYETPPRQTLAL